MQGTVAIIVLHVLVKITKCVSRILFFLVIVYYVTIFKID